LPLPAYLARGASLPSAHTHIGRLRPSVSQTKTHTHLPARARIAGTQSLASRRAAPPPIAPAGARHVPTGLHPRPSCCCPAASARPRPRSTPMRSGTSVWRTIASPGGALLQGGSTYCSGEAVRHVRVCTCCGLQVARCMLQVASCCCCCCCCYRLRVGAVERLCVTSELAQSSVACRRLRAGAWGRASCPSSRASFA
jgi:hypothetical protein